MKRRDLLRYLGTLAALAAMPQVGFTAMAGWKTAVGLNGFASGEGKYKKKYPIWEVLQFASSHGFDGIELVEGWLWNGYPTVDEKERVEAIIRMVGAYNLKIFSIQLGVDQAFDPDPEKRKQWRTKFQEQVKFASAIGCEHVGMWPGGGLRGQTIDQAIDVLADSFRQAAEIAGEYNIMPCFEIEPPFVFNTEEHMRRIFEKANHSNLKIIYDPSHFDLMNGSTGKPHEMLQRIGVENIGYLHFTDTDGTLLDGGTSKHLPCGDGHAHLEESLRVLKEGGFNGWIMIDEWEVPDPYRACVQCKEMIEKAR